MLEDGYDIEQYNEYDEGFDHGFSVGYRAYVDNLPTTHPYDSNRTAFKDGFDDGYVAGFAQARDEDPPY